MDSIQKMIKANNLLQSNLIDEWLMHDSLEAYYRESGFTGIAGGTVADLLCCLLSAPETPETPDPENVVLESLETLQRTCRGSMERLLQIAYRHQKTWFREQGFSVLASWLVLTDSLKRGVTHDEWRLGTDAEMPGDDALKDLDIRAFLSGYELGALLQRAPEHAPARNSELLPEKA